MPTIPDTFPFKEARPGQLEAIEKTIEAFNEGKKFVLLEGPTGCGKSAIAIAIARQYPSSFWITPAKFLQDQIVGDFGENGKWVGVHEPLIDLKGRNAYPCNFYERAILDDPKEIEGDRNIWRTKARRPQIKTDMSDPSFDPSAVTCDAGECRRQGESKFNYCVSDLGVHCPYFQRLYQAKNSKICLMNFHSFLYQTSMTQQFAPRSLMVIDECHNADNVLMGFVEFNLSDRSLQHEGVKFPKLDNVKQYMQYFEEIKLGDIIQNKIKVATLALDIKAADEWSNVAMKFTHLISSDPEKWVCEWEENKTGVSRTVSIKPIFIDEYADPYLFSKADRILLMSATILSKDLLCKELGIPDDQVKSIRMRSSFPPEIRPIYYQPCGKMSFEHKTKTMPKLIESVERICRHHQNERGIIHTHTFEIAHALMDKCASDVRSRFLFQKEAIFDGDKTALLEKHKSMPNGVIIAPAMHEGLDLKDDLGRFAIICKIPYPSKNDPQIAARLLITPDFYDWKTSLKLVQSYGRIYRHAEDFGSTYVLDSNFKWFVEKVIEKKFLPEWFVEAIHF